MCVTAWSHHYHLLGSAPRAETPPLRTEQGWEPELIIPAAWGQIQIPPISFGIDVPADASPVPRGVAVGVWGGLGPKIAQTSLVIVSNGNVEADNVTGLRSPKTKTWERAAKPTCVDSVDGTQRYAKLHYETVRAESRFRFPYDAGVVRGCCQALVAHRSDELKPLVIDDRVGTVGIVRPTADRHMGVARLAVAIDHDLRIIIKVRHGPVANDDVVGDVNGDLKVAVVVQRVDRETRIRRTVRSEQVWQANIRNHSRRSCRTTASLHKNRHRARPFRRAEYSIDCRRGLGVSGNHELLARDMTLRQRLGGRTSREQQQGPGHQ
jgi:hypothetical protein